MIKRRQSKQIKIGDIKVGGDAPISVQSMCNTDTRDVKTTLNQINELAEKGCEIVRLAVLNKDAADAIKAALLVGIDTKVEGITIKETVQTPRRSETQTTEYTGEDWINLQSAMATAYDRSRRLINEVAERKIFDVEVEQAQTTAPAQVAAQAQVVTQTQTAAPAQTTTQTASQIFETQPAGQPAEQAAAPAERQQTSEERINSELIRYFHQDQNDGMNL